MIFTLAVFKYLKLIFTELLSLHLNASPPRVAIHESKHSESCPIRWMTATEDCERFASRIDGKMNDLHKNIAIQISRVVLLLYRCFI